MKADVVDFESTAPVEEAPVADGKTLRKGDAQTKRRKIPGSQRSPSQSVNNTASRGPTQQSILSFLPISTNVPEGCAPAKHDSGTPGVPSQGSAAAHDVIDLEPQGLENVGARLGGALTGSSVDANRKGAAASASDGNGGGNGGVVSEPRDIEPTRSPSGSPPVAATGGKASTGPLPTKAKRGGRQVETQDLPKSRGRGYLSKDAGNRMGQALTEWSWHYFCTLWDAEGLGGDGADAGSLTSRPRESVSLARAEVGENRRPRGENDGKAVPTAAVLSGADAPRAAGKTITDGGLTAAAAAAASCDSGSTRYKGGRAEWARGGGQTSAAPNAARMRPPPPLFFQHDGHSRSVVGVLWLGGRGKPGNQCGGHGSSSGDGSAGRVRDFADGGGGGDGGDGGSSRNSGDCGGDTEGCGRRLRPGSLIVFDPSHSGREIRRALDDTQKLRWGR